MPVSPSPAHSSTPSPHPQRPRNRRLPRWVRPLLLAGVALMALACVSSVALFALTHGMAASPAAPFDTPAYARPQHSWQSTRRLLAAGADGKGEPATCTANGRTVWGDNIAVTRADHLCGDVNVYGGNASVDGSVTGNLTVVGGDAIVNGAVSGNVTTIGGNITLGAGADVGGNVDALGGDIQKATTALVGGNIERGFALHDITPLSWLGLTGGFVVRWWNMVFWGLAGALVAAVFPRQLREVRFVARRQPALSFATGLVALIGGVVAALVLFITCLGIPVALLLGVAMWLAWVVGTIAIGLWIGEGLLRLGGAPDRAPVLAAVMGVLLLALAESIPCLGGVLGLTVGFMGVGASTLAMLHSRQAAAMRSRAF